MTLLEWLKHRAWEPEVLIRRATNASSRGVSWPKAAQENKELFFDRLLECLEADVKKEVAIEVLEAWAAAYPGDSESLLRLAAGLSGQASVDFNSLDASVLPSAVEYGASGGPPTVGPGDDSNAVVTSHEPIITIPHPSAVFQETVERNSLFPQFLNFARERDIVFALGGAGSGLDTFKRQFGKHLNSKGLTVVDATELSPDSVRQLSSVRRVFEDARPGAESRAGTRVHLELKSLLTNLAFAAYRSLQGRFAAELNLALSERVFEDPLVFSEYFYSESLKSKKNPRAMYEADPVPVLKYFFETVQRFAEMTRVAEVLVLMPWKELAACFQGEAHPEDRQLGTVLWQALGELATRHQRSSPRIPYAQNVAPDPPLDLYDRVCIVVCCSEVPYAHNANQQKDLVARCLWPIPPLNRDEVERLVAKAFPGVEASSVAEMILHWTGGIPWFVRLLLSYVFDSNHLLGRYGGDPSLLIAACAKAAMGALELGGEGVPDPIGRFIRDHQKKVQAALGGTHSTDTTVEEKWAGPGYEVLEGYKIQPHRLEAFVASGLIWLKGDPWDLNRKDYVFSRYPTVQLDPARELPLAMYRSVTGRDVRIPGW